MAEDASGLPADYGDYGDSAFNSTGDYGEITVTGDYGDSAFNIDYGDVVDGVLCGICVCARMGVVETIHLRSAAHHDEA